MSKETRLVVKDNSLIDASFNLSLVEQRLMLMGIVEARELSILTFNTPIKVSVKSYIEQFGADKSNGYSQLQCAVDTLFERQFSYYDADMNERFKERWIYKASYMDDKGHVILFFTPTVISMISRLEANFTQYLIDEVKDFKSKYSIRLYELLVKYKDIGNSKKYTIDELRSLLGIENTEYKTMSLFKANVLDKAVKEIKEKTDMQIKYEQFKEGRTISHILFKLTQKKEKKPKKTEDIFNGMSVKQAVMFANKLSESDKFQSHYKAEIGESTKQYAEKIKLKLLDPFYVNAWMQYLENVGYIRNTLSK